MYPSYVMHWAVLLKLLYLTTYETKVLNLPSERV